MCPSAHPSQYCINAAHWAAVDAAWQKILDHPVFDGITSELPLDLGQSSVSPFKVADFNTAIQGVGTYTAGANAFWCSPFFSTTPGVPINRHGVQRLAAVVIELVPAFGLYMSRQWHLTPIVIVGCSHVISATSTVGSSCQPGMQ